MSQEETNPKPKLPTGTVTFLFTDIAGSSRLWEQHGDRFIPVWQTHDAVIRDAISRFRGHEVKSEGDSFMVAFEDPSDALNCALFTQAALSRYPWPEDIGPVWVRMGLHTGDPFLHGEDYFGPVVNRAANICKAANPGQVLISEETRRVAENRADYKISYHDHGEHRLKDMGPSQRLYQAHHPSLAQEVFTPPRTLEGRPNNLPVQRTSFVGRAREIEKIASFLSQGEKPVLTLTGPGGIGKTRLSLQAAAELSNWFPDGVWYVHLVEAKDVVGAAVEIATAMGIRLDPTKSALPQVQEWVANRRCLLVLDDAGSLPQADQLIRELLSGSSKLRCLATSRESLEIEEAEEMAVAGLSMTVEAAPVKPEGTTSVTPTEGLVATEAGRLLLERRAEVGARLDLTPDELKAVEQLLAEVEGAPVSIERISVLLDRMSPGGLLEWLKQRLSPAGAKTGGLDRFRDLVRQSAQWVQHTVEETAKMPTPNLSHLLQGIADIATDQNRAQEASQLGRESLRLSLENGDTLGVAAALRQLARVRWQQGDRQSAMAILGTAVQIYRRHNAPEQTEAQHELDRLRAQLDHIGTASLDAPSFNDAVVLALGDTAKPPDR